VPEKQAESKASENFETKVTLSPEARKNAGITTGLAPMEKMEISLKVNGMVDVPPESLVSISFPYGGFLKTTDMLPGRKVVKGQVLGVMEDQAYVQLQQDYLTSISKLQLLKMDFDRQTELRQGDASSKKAFETAKAEYEMQQILVKGLAEKLKILGVSPETLSVDKISRTVPIRSPISGFVKSVFVNVGKYVDPSDVLFEIVDPDHIHGSLVVFEKDQHLVRHGLLMNVVNPSRPEKVYRGEIILVSKNVDSTRGVTIHSHFIGDHSDLIPGMYITAEIFTESTMLPVVPESAVVRLEGKHYVFIVNGDGSYTMTEVKVGEAKNGKISLTANYIDWEKQQIVLTGAYGLLGKLKNTAEEE
jgi:cobalt-zinc-cadmium efflux system membrane fusion protein